MVKALRAWQGDGHHVEIAKNGLILTIIRIKSKLLMMNLSLVDSIQDMYCLSGRNKCDKLVL